MTVAIMVFVIMAVASMGLSAGMALWDVHRDFSHGQFYEGLTVALFLAGICWIIAALIAIAIVAT
jgi:hypothetical protein